MSAVAKLMGVCPQTAKQHYKAGHKKLATVAGKPATTVLLKRDSRGQVIESVEDDDVEVYE